MNFHTLEYTSIDEITDVFNQAFADYLVPFKLTKEQLVLKIQAENIQLTHSAGAFVENLLVGFILHGVDPAQKVAYNGGTGVIPEQRGKQLTQQMYGFLLPRLRQMGFENVQLEVISANTTAYKSYEAVGFDKVRELVSFKGIIDIPQTSSAFEIKPLEERHWPVLSTFWDWQPTWQNHTNAMKNSTNSVQAFGVFHQNQLLAYAIVNPSSKRIHQFAVHKNHRKQGVGRRLFAAISESLQGECSLINIDAASAPTLSFLSNIGLKPFINQYEMGLELKAIFQRTI